MPKMTTDDGIEIHYHVDDFRDPWASDPGDTILMSHGFCRGMKWWTQWVPALARKYRVVRYDIRGCGQSDVPPEGAVWSADRLARDPLNLVDYLGIEKFHWVGFESGGLWGVVFATTYPDRVKSLTMCGTPYARIGGLSGTSETINRVGLKQWLVDSTPSQLDVSAAAPGLVEWHIAEHSKTPTQVAVSTMRAVEALDITDMLPKISVPTLIMVGDRSTRRPLDEQSAMQQRIPNARLVVFPNIGSGIHLLIPDRCTEELIRFLGSG